MTAADADAMTVGELMESLSRRLVGPGVPPARAQARDLIAAVLDRPRFWPSANADSALAATDALAIEAAAARFREGMPMQYAVGKAGFRQLTLAVDRRVLIPRPETELLVELVLAAQRGGRGTVVDVGTGSGAIALALASEGGFERVIATDISADALAVAHENLGAIAEDRRARVEFRQGQLLAPVAGERVEVVVSNPPYISPAEARELPALVHDWEPHLALFADDDGMAAIRALVPEAAAVLLPGGLLALEVDARRADLAVAAVAADPRFTEVEHRLDLTGRPRFVVARRQES
ncbi:MAG: peptide chain release factor N(5)-glutamine methyltransferase [Gemmatimonadaceae bacterium]|nr:peptide chain release factor N(5)-glutamine methyltransferase [Gemmatimonadaceae bacterium]